MNKQELIEKAVMDWQGEFKADCDIVYEYSGPGSFAACAKSYLGNRECLFTREEFNSAADRLRGKPDWKDAPVWAQWLAQDTSGDWHWYPRQENPPTQSTVGFVNKSAHRLKNACSGKVIGDWRNTLERRPEQKPLPSIADRYGVEIPWGGRNALPSDVDCNCEVEVTLALGGAKYTETGNANQFNWMLVKSYKVIDERYKPAEPEPKPAPAKPWFEAGELPPAGVKVEAIIELNYEECEVIAYFEDMAWLSVGGSKRRPVRMIEACKFRPIKADKEKAIEAAESVIRKTSSAVDNVSLDALYDAGLLRLPDQK